MNVFGAFTLGSLMKSLLPGALIFSAMWFSLECFGVPDLLSIKLTPVLSLPMAFIFSILLGLIVNTVVFMGCIDFLVRRHHDQTDRFREIERLKYNIDNTILKYYAKCFNDCEGEQCYEVKDFKNVIDVRFMLQVRAGESSFAGLKEAYWSWLESQINLAVAILISVVFLLPTILFSSSKLSAILGDYRFTITVLFVLACLLLVFFLICAARSNYLKDREKQLSLIVGAFVDAQQSSECREANRGQSFSFPWSRT